MTYTTRQQKGLSQHIKTSNDLLSDNEIVHKKPFTEISDLVASWESIPEMKDAMQSARKWLTTIMDQPDRVTLKSLRLAKGWSQADLARLIGTGQPHIARIERGTENINLSTCRKLCLALGIDMNTLNVALGERRT